MQSWVQDYIDREMSGEPYIAVHLRIGSDWVCCTDNSAVISMTVFLHVGKCSIPLAGVTRLMQCEQSVCT